MKKICKYWVMVAVLFTACASKRSVSPSVIRGLVSQLEFSNCVVTGGVGFTGKDNPAADAYKALLRMAPDSVWVRLSYNEKPVVRMYALLALLSKKSPELEQVRTRLEKDTAAVCEISGDITDSISIGGFVSMSRRWEKFK